LSPLKIVPSPVRFEPLSISQSRATPYGLSLKGKFKPDCFCNLISAKNACVQRVLENHINFPCTCRPRDWLGIIQP
jgi:hypothetical protein